MRFVKEVMKKLELVEVVVPKVKVVERVVSPAGELEFRQKPLEEIMNVLADWYSVVFEDDSLRKMRLGGSIRRADQMEWVLDMLTQKIINEQISRRMMQTDILLMESKTARQEV